MFAGVARWIGFLTMAAGATGLILLAGEFVRFVSSIASDEVSLESKADGIVALTGAAGRIPDAIELLATERGKRLLITGVHRATSSREIGELRHSIPSILPAALTSIARHSIRSATRWKPGAGHGNTISIP